MAGGSATGGFVRRGATVVVAAVAAVAAIVSTADRLDRQNRLPQGLSGLLIGGGAQAQSASRAYFTGDIARARALALRAVVAEPGNQLAVRTLGLAAFAAGDAVRSDGLMRAAGALGWRDPPTQTFWSAVAAQAGDYTVAAQRLDAAMRITQGADPAVTRLVVALEATEAGRAALAERMVAANDWSNAYLIDLQPLGDDQLADRAALAATLARRRAPIARWAFVTTENLLVNRGHAADAFAIRIAADGGGAGPRPLPANGGFEQPLVDPPSLFDWRLAPGDTLFAEVATAPAPMAGRALHVRSSGAAAAQIAEQYVVLARGVWLLGLELAGNRTPDPVLVQMATPSGAQARLTALPSGGRRRTWRIVVDTPSEVHLLRLLLTGEEARRSADLWIDRVTLTPDHG